MVIFSSAKKLVWDLAQNFFVGLAMMYCSRSLYGIGLNSMKGGGVWGGCTFTHMFLKYLDCVAPVNCRCNQFLSMGAIVERGSGSSLFLPRILLQMLKISLKYVLLSARASRKKDTFWLGPTCLS